MVEFVAEGGFWCFVWFWGGCGFLLWVCHVLRGGIVGGWWKGPGSVNTGIALLGWIVL